MRTMRLLRRLGPFVVLGSVVGTTPASASDVAVQATLLNGSRSLTTATLGVLANVVRSQSVSATLAATVTEAAVDGDANWSVTTRLCGPNNVTTPTASDCATYPDQLVKAGGGGTIAGSNVTISNRSVTPVLGGGTSTAVSGSQDLSATRTIFANAGQDPLTLYTGTYASTSTITLNAPSNATAAVYNGYLVVTLVQ